MPGPESVRGYLDAVEAQIRWKRARTVAARELETHLEAQQEEFLAEGHPPEEAERLAVEDMGDPVAVGADLDRLHRPRPQWGMLGLTLALLLVGGWIAVAALTALCAWLLVRSHLKTPGLKEEAEKALLPLETAETPDEVLCACIGEV